MRLILDIKDNEAAFFIKVLQNFPFVKATEVPEETEFIKGFKEAVEDVKLHKQGKKKLNNVRDLLDEI